MIASTVTDIVYEPNGQMATIDRDTSHNARRRSPGSNGLERRIVNDLIILHLKTVCGIKRIDHMVVRFRYRMGGGEGKTLMQNPRDIDRYFLFLLRQQGITTT